MRNEFHDDPNARLRAALHDGDPAAGDKLAPEEVWALRRAVQNAADEAGKRAWLPAAALAAGAAAVAAAVVVSSVQVRTGGPEPPRVAARAGVPQATVAPPITPSAASEPAPEPPPATPRQRVPRVKAPVALAQPPEPPPPTAEPLLALPTQPVLAAAATEPASEPRPLQVQFATPGGTRVIWMLAEESES